MAEPISCFLSERYLNRIERGSGEVRMSVEEASKQPQFSPVKETAALARTMVRAALKGSLGTLLHPSGHPYASLLLTATEPDGSPVLLISKLALHTKNLAVDARASLLIDATGTDADPMAGARITLIGEARPTASATARRRYLARHPAAAGYADFPDSRSSRSISRARTTSAASAASSTSRPPIY
ncbi:MAG: pyridoxamine 5'-phosphate oxidase family protein [Hyphomicrobium sp.]